MTDTNPNVTKHGIEVKPGQVWLDLDVRSNGRKVTVTKVEDGYATCRVGNGRNTRIAVKRMHTTTTGYRLLEDAP